jgi:hypothetical protein
MRFVATDSIADNLARVLQRAQAGGHGAHEREIRAIHQASVTNCRHGGELGPQRGKPLTCLGVLCWTRERSFVACDRYEQVALSRRQVFSVLARHPFVSRTTAQAGTRPDWLAGPTGCLRNGPSSIN